MNIVRILLSVAFLCVALPVVATPGDDSQARALTGFERITLSDYRGPFPPYRDRPDDLIGERIEVGSTFYDYQANGTLSKQIAVDEDGNAHLIWMRGEEPELINGVWTFNERHIFYNYIVDGEAQFEDGVAVDNLQMAGYTNLGIHPEFGAGPFFHSSEGGGLRNNVSVDTDFGEGDFLIYAGPRLNNSNWVWPHGSMDRQGRSHHLARFYPDGNEQNPVAIQYARGEMNDDWEWEFADPEAIALVKALSYTVATSPVSDRVAIIYLAPVYEEGENNRWQGMTGPPAANSNVMVVEAEDGEDFDWENPLNVTDFLRPNPDEDEDSPFFLGDTLRTHLFIDGCYDNDDNLHLVFTTPMLVENPDPNAGNALLRYNEEKNYVWHWDSETEMISLVANGWYDTAGLVGAFRSNLSYPSIGVDGDNNLYCAFTAFLPGDDVAQNNQVNGEIFVSKSIDGGNSWSVGINVTDTQSPGADVGECQSECWMTMAERIGDFVHISYVLDLDAGGIVQREGGATDNPFMYHRVPVDEIPESPKVLGRNMHVGLPPEIVIDDELPVLPGVPEGDPGEMDMAIGNGNEDGTALHVMVSAEGEFEQIIDFQPAVLRIAPGEEGEVTILFYPPGDGEFEGTILVEHNDPEHESPIELEFHGIGAEGYGSLSGTVIDRANDEGIRGATVTLDPGNYRAVSDENGNYAFERVPAWIYFVTCEADEFLLYEDEIEIEVDEDAEMDIPMSFAMFEVDPDAVNVQVPADGQVEETVTLRNEGNGPVSYSVNIAFPEGAEAEPWEMRDAYQVGADVDDSRIEGVVFIDDRFYVSGAAGGDPQIYIFNHFGEFIDSYDQLGDDNRGMRDLAWDGEHLWGGVDRTVYGFTRDGEQSTQFEGPMNPVTGLAWDSDREVLWMCGTTTDIQAVTLEGDVIEDLEIDRRDLRMYGLAYWPGDPDGYPLYIFHKDRDSDQETINKVNPDNGEMQFVRTLEPENGGSPGGAFITNQYDVYSWVLMGISSTSNNDGGDRIDIWQLAARKDYIAVEPMEGQVGAESEGEVALQLSAMDFPAELELEATVEFTHNGRGDMVELPVLIEVTAEGGAAERELVIPRGWSIISLNIEPEIVDVVELMQPLVDEELLILLKDGEGRFYTPEFEFNNIPRWEASEGYQIKMAEDGSLVVTGAAIAWDTPIPLERGWQIVSYYPREEADVVAALAGIEDVLEIAKDAFGHFYLPEFEFSNMEPLREGRGYFVKVSEDVDLVYRVEEFAAEAEPGSKLSHFPELPARQENMSVLLMMVPEGISEIGITTDTGVLTGAAAVDVSRRAGVAVWNDDSQANVIGEGDSIRVTAWNGIEEFGLDVDWIYGEPTFTPNGVAVGEVKPLTGTPTEYALYPPFPNPFNGRALISFDLPETSPVRLVLFDTSGRAIRSLVNERREAGRHSVIVDAAQLTSGLYFCKIHAGDFSQMHKVILLK